MKKLIFRIIFVLTFLFPAFLISCDGDKIANEEVTLSRMFRPVTFNASINGNEITLSWTNIADAIYLLELSQDELLFTTNLLEYKIEDASNIVLKDLLSATRYSARVKAVSKDGISEDSGWQEITFVTGE